MRAYSEVYLKEIVETQGDLFESVREYAPGIDVKNFIEAYMSGRTRSYIDSAKAYVCTMDAEELWKYFQKEEHFCEFFVCFALKQKRSRKNLPNSLILCAFCLIFSWKCVTVLV